MALFVCLITATHLYAASTSLFVGRGTGDFGELDAFYTTNQGTFRATHHPAVSVPLPGSDGVFFVFDALETHYGFGFGARLGGVLTVGEYPNATRIPSSAPQLFLGFADHCISALGDFTVKQLEIGPGDTVTAFWATFQKRCSFGLRGEVRWNAAVPIEMSAPVELNARAGEMIAFDVTASATNGGTTTLTVNTLPEGSAFGQVSSGTAKFIWPTTPRNIGIHYLTFKATNSIGQSEEFYTRITIKAVVPANDEFTNATIVPALPFVDVLDTREATNPADPPAAFPGLRTVWYSITATQTMTIEVSTAGSDFLGIINVFAASVSNGTVVQGYPELLRFRATAGMTYLVQAGTPTYGLPWGPNLVISMVQSAIELPPNDDFVNATVITNLPFTETVDTRVATGVEGCAGATRTVWYSFTPPQDMTVQANTLGSDFTGAVGVFRGVELQSVSCAVDRAQFLALAGQTYYFNVGTASLQDGTNLVFSLSASTDVADYGIAKANRYLQKRATGRGKYGSFFSAFANKVPGGDLTFVSLGYSGADEERSLFPNPYGYAGESRFSNPAALSKSFPSGEYTLTIGAVNDGTNRFTITMPGGDYPIAPHVNNWKAAQMIDSSRDFTLTWDAFLGATTNDQIQLQIFDRNDEKVFQTSAANLPGAIAGNSTFGVIPAFTLYTPASFVGVVSFVRNKMVDRTHYPGSVGSSSFRSEVAFLIYTGSGSGTTAGTLEFSSPRYEVLRNGGVAIITVVRSRGSKGIVSVDFANDASSSAMETDVSGTLNFAEGETSKTFSVSIPGDAETGEAVRLLLSNPTGGARLGLRKTTLVIHDAF